MADLKDLIDPTNGAQMEDWSALPPGEYLAAITQSERKPTKANPANHYLQLAFTIADGEHKGRKFWTLLNLWNQNEQAAHIAHREWNSIKQACGKAQV